MILGLLSKLFGCGDGKPGIFSSNGYHVGAEKVWYKSSTGMSYNVNEVMGADPKTFAVREFSSKISGETMDFGVSSNRIFWAVWTIEGADLASFEYLGSSYSKDKNAVYYMADRLTEDIAHFAMVSRQFVKDSKYVYFGRDVFSEDPAHFTRVGEEASNFYRDSQKCWYDIYEIKDADPNTFRYLGPKTATDATRVYHEMNEVEGAELKTYQILALDYAKDAHSVYRHGQRHETADPTTFKVLDEDYSLG